MLKLTTLEGDPLQYRLGELDTDDVDTLQGAVNEAHVRAQKEKTDPPNLEGFKSKVMKLKVKRGEVASLTLDEPALGGLVRVLEVFHNRTLERSKYMAINTSAHDHRNAMWFEREELGERAALMAHIIETARLPEVREWEALVANDSLSFGQMQMPLLSAGEGGTTTQLPNAPVKPAPNDQPTQ